MPRGRVTRIIQDRGFGFIAPDGGGTGKDVFFHVRDLTAGLDWDEQLLELEVSYTVVEGQKGPRATAVKRLRG